MTSTDQKHDGLRLPDLLQRFPRRRCGQIFKMALPRTRFDLTHIIFDVSKHDQYKRFFSTLVFSGGAVETGLSNQMGDTEKA